MSTWKQYATSRDYYLRNVKAFGAPGHIAALIVFRGLLPLDLQRGAIRVPYLSECILSNEEINPDRTAAPADGAALADVLLASMLLVNRISDHKLLAGDGISISEWASLSEFPAEGEIVLKKLIKLTGLPPQRTKVLLAKLESRGMVHRIVAEGETQSRRFALSASGLLFRGEVGKLLMAMEESLLDPAQRRALSRSGRVMQRIAKKLGKGGDPL